MCKCNAFRMFFDIFLPATNKKRKKTKLELNENNHNRLLHIYMVISLTGIWNTLVKKVANALSMYRDGISARRVDLPSAWRRICDEKVSNQNTFIHHSQSFRCLSATHFRSQLTLNYSTNNNRQQIFIGANDIAQVTQQILANDKHKIHLCQRQRNRPRTTNQ